MNNITTSTLMSLTEKSFKWYAHSLRPYENSSNNALAFQCLIGRDHSFLRQIFPNSAGHFAKFRGSPRQIFHI